MPLARFLSPKSSSRIDCFSRKLTDEFLCLSINKEQHPVLIHLISPFYEELLNNLIKKFTKTIKLLIAVI